MDLSYRGGGASKVYYYQCGVLESQEFLVLTVGVDDWLRLLYVHNSTTTPRLHWRLRFDPPSSAYKKPQQRTACVFLPGVRRSCIFIGPTHTLRVILFLVFVDCLVYICKTTTTHCLAMTCVLLLFDSSKAENPPRDALHSRSRPTLYAFFLLSFLFSSSSSPRSSIRKRNGI